MFDEKSYNIKMDKAIEVFSKELSSLRTGRANAAMLDLVKVDVYGQQMFDYISDNYEGGEVDIEVSDEIVVDEALLNVGNEKEAVDAEKAGFEGTIQIKKDLGESKKIKSITGKEISKLFISKSKNK